MMGNAEVVNVTVRRDGVVRDVRRRTLMTVTRNARITRCATGSPLLRWGVGVQEQLMERPVT
jgi:hypothetical protein